MDSNTLKLEDEKRQKNFFYGIDRKRSSYRVGLIGSITTGLLPRRNPTEDSNMPYGVVPSIT